MANYYLRRNDGIDGVIRFPKKHSANMAAKMLHRFQKDYRAHCKMSGAVGLDNLFTFKFKVIKERL